MVLIAKGKKKRAARVKGDSVTNRARLACSLQGGEQRNFPGIFLFWKKKMSLQTTTRLKVSYPFSCAEIPNSEACWLEGSTDNFFFFKSQELRDSKVFKSCAHGELLTERGWGQSWVSWYGDHCERSEGMKWLCMWVSDLLATVR